MKNYAIAIDGPAGAGKSTISKILAKELGIDYIDTGAMYRALTLKILNTGIDLYDEKKITEVLKNTSIDFRNNHIFLDGINVDEEIRNNEVSTKVSIIAKMIEVRKILVDVQRKIANNKSVVMDGRDIGTFVLPNAEFKFYITASVNERGIRRFKELKEKGYDVELNKIIEEIENRDRIDSTRDFAPLKKSLDAIEIDTTGKSINEIIIQILEIVKKGGY
ncbi:(d)CMP kinase [Brassicibacter mesophilus]|uniref:(d)CMP kinase n=1 Tax=Brassicibacter mesophilus TaxID=745119 RepID=UPI003D22777D